MHPSQCSLCGHDNPVSAKFCNECASPLDVALCACGAINEKTDARCYKCGAPLGPARAAVPSADLEDRVGRVEARLHALERHLKDLAAPQQGRAPSGALAGDKHPPSAPRQSFASSEGAEGDSPPMGAGPSEGEPRGFMGKPAGPEALVTALPVRPPRFAAVAIVMAVALAAAGGAYVRHLQQSLSRPTATGATSTAGVAPQAEGVGTTSPNEATRPPLDETPQRGAPMPSSVGSADAESTAALPASPTAPAPQPIPPPQ
jgi:Double zinc ribbon